MNLEKIEYGIFAIIVVLQIVSFIRTRAKISEFNISIAEISTIAISDLKLTPSQVDEFSSRADIFEVARNRKVNLIDEQPETNDGSELVITEKTEDSEFEEIKYSPGMGEDPAETIVKIKLVESTTNNSIVFNKVLNSLNKYLLRNRHSVADFSLIKDIVERNTDIIEEEVHLTLSTPLYLGLMGTMLGVVIGIFSMSNLIGAEIKDESISDGIALFLGSVKIAMIASFVGLLLTIYNSAVSFKASKNTLESKKNDFYTLIQVELLPSLNQGMNVTFDSLQRNLFKFNEKFDLNLDRLSTVFDKNYDSIIMQKALVEQLDKTKIADISRYNVRVLNEMNTSLTQFDKFNSMFSNINTYLANSYKLADRSTELLQRTDDFEKIAETIKENLSDNSKLINFLSEHFKDLERHKNKVDEAVVNVGFNIKDTFEQLTISLQNSSKVLGEEAIARNIESKALFDEFSTDLRNSLQSQVDIVGSIMEQKKSSFDHLKHLETLLKEVQSIKGGSKQMPDHLETEISQLNSGLHITNETLKRIERDAKKPFFKKIFSQNNA